MNVTVEGTDLTHIFRALSCLYLGMVTFCIIAAFTPEWRHVAVIWAVFFAYSLAIGRILSLVVDGKPNGMLLFFLAVELIVGTVGLLLLQSRAAHRPSLGIGDFIRREAYVRGINSADCRRSEPRLG